MCFINVTVTLQASVTEYDLCRITKLANDVIEAKTPVYCTTLSLDSALNIPGVAFLPDEVTWLSLLAQLTELFIEAGHSQTTILSLCVCPSVWMLTAVAQIVTAAHRDL